MPVSGDQSVDIHSWSPLFYFLKKRITEVEDENILQIYSFLRAVRGNWRNAIFVSCGCDTCVYGREKPCPGFLLTVDECGQVMLLPAETIHELTGEEVEPAECSAVLSHRSFDAAFSKYIEWHTPNSSACTLRQLCLDPSCSQNS